VDYELLLVRVSASAEESLVGVTLDGRFQILGRVGQGGMGVVYRALQLSVGREVALKVIKKGLGSDAAARFLREARLASQLQHPGIVVVHDSGTTSDGVAYLAMEMLEGRSLRELLAADKRLPLQRALGIARQLCAALDAAHTAGIVHRDLKPGNVMILDGDRVKLVDFGLARSLSVGDDSTITQEGHVPGTASYLAPEVVRGDEASPKSDLFALGLILHEMLGGAHPFDAPSAEARLARMLTDEPPRLADVPADVGRALERLLAKQPSERPPSAAIAAEWLSGGEVTRPAPPPSSDRTRMLVWLGAAVAIAAVVGGAFAWRAMAKPDVHRTYRGTYESASPNNKLCTNGSTWMRVEGDRITGQSKADTGQSFDSVGTLRKNGKAFGAFMLGDRVIGTFEGRIDADSAIGTSIDHVFGCEGRFSMTAEK
jgi:serine/threonine protein kinase